MSAKRGRSPGFRMSEAHRVKIQNSNVLNALVEHVEGRLQCSSRRLATAQQLDIYNGGAYGSVDQLAGNQSCGGSLVGVWPIS